jgi:hypothetical protein
VRIPQRATFSVASNPCPSRRGAASRWSRLPRREQPGTGCQMFGRLLDRVPTYGRGVVDT